MTHYASVYPLVTTRALARPFTYEVPEDVERGDVVSVRLGGARQRGVVIELEDAPPEGIEAAPIERVVESLPAPLVELALWLADYYGSTPGRALALVAPAKRARRKELPQPAERDSLAGRARAGGADRLAGARARQARGALRRARRPLPALRRDRQREDRGLPPGRGRGARPRPRRDRPRPRDRARAADGRPVPGALRRPRGDPPLVAERGGAARRARAHRVGGGADRDRCALGDLRPAAAARPDLRRRGARRRRTSRSPTRATTRARWPRSAPRSRAPSRSTGARRRGPRAGSGSSGSSSASGSASALRRCGSSTCAARPATRSPRRCSPSSASSPRAAGKAILLLNRRGVAPALHCRACGETRRCPNCDVALVLHRDERAALPPLRRSRSRRPRPAPPAARSSSRGSAPARSGSSASWKRAFPELERFRLDADAVDEARRARRDAPALRRGRPRGARRDADGRQGAPLRGRLARRGDRRRHGSRRAGLPRRGAHVPARHAARRAQRPGRARARPRPDVPARVARRRARCAPRRRGLPRGRARAQARARLSAVTGTSSASSSAARTGRRDAGADASSPTGSRTPRASCSARPRSSGSADGTARSSSRRRTSRARSRRVRATRVRGPAMRRRSVSGRRRRSAEPLSSQHGCGHAGSRHGLSVIAAMPGASSTLTPRASD